MTIRVAFRLVKVNRWTGGVNYVLNLCRVLKAHAPLIEPVLFAPPDIDADLRDTIVEALGGQPIAMRDRSQVDEILAVAGVHETIAARAFRDAGVDLVFEGAGYYGPRFGLPILAWLPDFQHRRLPQFFSRGQWLARDIRYRNVLGVRKTVMLSSQDARADMLRFYGPPRGEVHVAPFAICMNSPVTFADGEGVRLAHGLPDRFIFLPNQFWTHKNHRVVVEALGRLPAEERPCIATSGLVVDPRAPGAAQALLERLEAYGAQDNFRILGHLPFADVMALNARADALLNPSFFEGWSTTVEEAKALGTPMLLSDLAVHREQVGDGAIFFDPDDPDDCAKALRAVAARPKRRGDPIAQIVARNQEAQKRFAGLLTQAIQAAFDAGA